MWFIYFNFLAEKVDKMENDELDDGEVDDDDEEEMSDELKSTILVTALFGFILLRKTFLCISCQMN